MNFPLCVGHHVPTQAVAELEGELRDGMREVEDDLGKRVTRGELERAMKTVASMGQVENLVETRINLRFTEEEVRKGGGSCAYVCVFFFFFFSI